MRLNGEAVTMQRLLANARGQDYSIEETVTACKQLSRARRAFVADELKADATAIKQYAIDHNEAVREEFKSFLTDSREELHAFHVAPSPVGGGVALLEMRDEVSPELASDLFDFCQTNFDRRQKGDVLGAVEGMWKHLHRNMETSDQQKDSSSEDASNEETLCCIHGMCLCGARGQRVWSFRNNLIRATKTAFPRESLYRTDMLLAGKVFIRFRGSSTETADQELAEFWGIEPRTKIWHISTLSQAPFEIEYQEMQIATGLDADAACPAGDELPLVAQCGWLDTLRAVETLEIDGMAWDIDWLQLCMHRRLLQVFAPGAVLAAPFPDVAASRVWPAAPAPARPHPKRRIRKKTTWRGGGGRGGQGLRKDAAVARATQAVPLVHLGAYRPDLNLLVLEVRRQCSCMGMRLYLLTEVAPQTQLPIR